MSDGPTVTLRGEPWDLGDYCRNVEERLARVNEGHVIRIVGPAFELVRGWALAGIPLAIVYRGIEQKAERHRVGRSRRPLRLEFCEADVRTLYDDWRRAVGVTTGSGEAGTGEAALASPVLEERRRPSLVRQLDRAVDKLVRAAGRLELPDSLRSDSSRLLDELTAIRELGRQARGDARRVLVERIASVDREIGVAARRAAASVLADVEAEATADLAPFRSRLAADAWQRSLDASVDRALRDRFGLPTLDLPLPPS